jgi:hypothetical protein
MVDTRHHTRLHKYVEVDYELNDLWMITQTLDRPPCQNVDALIRIVVQKDLEALASHKTGRTN